MMDFGLEKRTLVKFTPSRLGYITQYVEPIQCEVGIEVARSYFSQHPDWNSLPVEKDGGVVGLVTRDTVLHRASTFMGALSSKGLDRFLQEGTLILDAFESVERALSTALKGDEERLDKDFLIYHRGRFLGVGRLIDLIKHADALRRQDMGEAEQVQRHLIELGSDKPEGLAVHRSIRMAHELGGDFSQVLDLGRGRTLVTCFDVSGKGVSAALMTGVISSYFSTLSVSGRLERIGPTETVRMLNRAIKESSNLGKFVVGALLFIDPREGYITLFNMGLGPAYVFWRAEGGREKLAVQEPVGAPLGLEEAPDLGAARKVMPVLPDMRIFLHSDGLSDARNPDGAMWGEDAIKAFLVSHRDLNGKRMIGKLDADISAYISTAPQADDITSILVDFRKEAAEEPEGSEPNAAADAGGEGDDFGVEMIIDC